MVYISIFLLCENVLYGVFVSLVQSIKYIQTINSNDKTGLNSG